MKKSLLALAVLGAFAGVAQAQSAVTIYGVLDAAIARSYGDVVAAGEGARTFMQSGGSAGSRIGFRGTEDLGNGLQGIFTIEAGFNIDNGTSAQGVSAGNERLFGRQAFVGLKHNSFGTVSLGRQQNLVRLALLDFDPFALAYAGDASNLFSTYGQRMDNSVKYATPTWSGFIAELMYGFGETDNTEEARQYEGSLGYTNGPIGVKFVHHTSRGTAAAGGIPVARTNSIYGSYNFGVAKLSLGFADNDNAAGLTVGPASTTAESRDYLIGLVAPFGANTLRASYIQKKDRVGDADADQIGLGYDYALSKRTSFYTSWARISNDAGAAYAATGSGAGNNTEKLFNVGVRHSF